MAKPHLTHDKDNNAITWQVGWSDFLEKWTLGMLCQIIKGPTFFFEMLIRFESENFVAHALRARGQIRWIFWNWSHIIIPDRQHNARFRKSQQSSISLHPNDQLYCNTHQKQIPVQFIFVSVHIMNIKMMTFYDVWIFYDKSDVCRHSTLYDVFHHMMFVAYDVCRLIMFVAYDVCRHAHMH